MTRREAYWDGPARVLWVAGVIALAVLLLAAVLA